MCCYVDPDLVYDKCLERDDGFENALDLFPAGYRPTAVQPEMSGVFSVCSCFHLAYILCSTLHLQYVLVSIMLISVGVGNRLVTGRLL